MEDFARGQALDTVLLLCVSTAISAIPTGLPTFVQTMLSSGARRLAEIAIGRKHDEMLPAEALEELHGGARGGHDFAAAGRVLGGAVERNGNDPAAAFRRLSTVYVLMIICGYLGPSSAKRAKPAPGLAGS